jgi:hypothetical protein
MTMLQSDRRRDPYPFTWEIPVGILTGWLLLAGLGIQLARTLANWTAGAGWIWPTGKALYSSLPAVLAGNPQTGLILHPATASRAALYGWIITIQLLLAVATILAAFWMYRRWGAGRMKGMASGAEAEAVLGVTRLRRNSAVIRPDLQEAHTKQRRQR